MTARRAQRARSTLRAAAPARAHVAAEHVILVHGIWMRGITLHFLAQHLRRAGYRVDIFDYASVFGGFAQGVQGLRERIRALDASVVHLVGHSLGGLVALEALRSDDEPPRGRVVCLGTPLRGSAVARGLAAIPGGRWLLGHSADALLAGLEDWRGKHRVGVIAGDLPIGFGSALGTLVSPHDGTVSIAETQLPGIADHRTVSSSHTGMLLSSEVAELTVGFLRRGRFDASREDAAARDG